MLFDVSHDRDVNVHLREEQRIRIVGERENKRKQKRAVSCER